jgi:hypothetical protein
MVVDKLRNKRPTLASCSPAEGSVQGELRWDGPRVTLMRDRAVADQPGPSRRIGGAVRIKPVAVHRTRPIPVRTPPAQRAAPCTAPRPLRCPRPLPEPSFASVSDSKSRVND